MRNESEKPIFENLILELKCAVRAWFHSLSAESFLDCCGIERFGRRSSILREFLRALHQDSDAWDNPYNIVLMIATIELHETAQVPLVRLSPQAHPSSLLNHLFGRQLERRYPLL